MANGGTTSESSASALSRRIGRHGGRPSNSGKLIQNLAGAEAARTAGNFLGDMREEPFCGDIFLKHERLPFSDARLERKVGEVLATSTSLEPAYTLTGDELYVRAVIRSDEVMTNPIKPGEKQQAWTQPVGWEVK